MKVRWMFGVALLLPTSFSVTAINAIEPKTSGKSKISMSATAEAVLAKEAQGQPVIRHELATTDPHNDYCYWLAGQIQTGERWRSVNDIEAEDRSDLTAAYEQKRGESELTVDRHRELARWCSSNGLDLQAKAHWTAVTDYSADDIEARGQLKQIWISGVWYSQNEIAEADARLKQLAQDLKKWLPASQKILKGFASDNVATQKQALADLKAIDDPSAIAAIEVACYQVDDALSGPFVEAIAQFRTPIACAALTRIALADPQSKRGELAATKVKAYPHEFYVPELLGLLSTPIETRVKYGVNNQGELQLQRAMFRTTNKERQLIEYNRLVRVNESVALQINVGEFVSVAGSSRRSEGSIKSISKNSSFTNVAIDEIAAAKQAVQEQAELDQKIAKYNHDNEMKSKNIYAVLTRTTGQSLVAEPEAWWEWWRKYNYRSKAAKPLTQKIYNQVDKAKTTVEQMRYAGAIQRSCLVAGTEVQTQKGLRPVESIRVGDLVLSQDVESGELALKPVVRTTLRAPETIYCIKTEAGDIRATGGHRWWVAGRGWQMSAQLEPEMLFHNATGTTKIIAIEVEPEALPSHNLVVDEFHTYFVGRERVLSFDNVDPVPTLCKVPGYIN